MSLFRGLEKGGVHKKEEHRPEYRGEVIAALENVTHRYDEKTVALRGVSIAVPLNELVILTGLSGSGKSTALEFLAGIKDHGPTKGRVMLFGQSLYEQSEKNRNRLKRNHVGIGFQKANIDPSFTVADIVRGTAAANNLRISQQRVVELGRHFRMLDKLGVEGGKLSGGEQMRASMMRALAGHPDLILLDEPTAAVDTKSKVAAISLLRDIIKEEQATVVMVTHEPEIAREFADREYVMESGEVIAMHTYNQIPTPGEVRIALEADYRSAELPNVS